MRIRAIAITALALTLAACSSGGTDRPNGGTSAGGTLAGSGSTFAQNFVQACAPAFTKESGISVTYAGGGSGKGRTDITNKTVDFAMSDSPFSSDAPANILHIPVVAGPLAIVYRLDGVIELRLSPTSLASIFAGKVTSWNDQAIAADNPGLTLPKRPIQVVYRQDSSGSSDVLTKYLKANASSIWTSDSGSDFAGVFPGKLPTNGSFQGASGSDAVTQKVKDTNGAITYAELSFAKERELPTALLQNGAGEFVAANPEAASTFLADVQMDENGIIAIDYTAKVTGGYNLTAYTYALAYPGGDKAAQIADFLTSLLEKCSDQATRLQYAPLEGNLQTQALDLVSRLRQ